MIGLLQLHSLAARLACVPSAPAQEGGAGCMLVMLAGCVGWLCWLAALAGYIGWLCWLVVLAGCIGWLCWLVVLAGCVGWLCWLHWLESLLPLHRAQFVGRHLLVHPMD